MYRNNIHQRGQFDRLPLPQFYARSIQGQFRMDPISLQNYPESSNFKNSHRNPLGIQGCFEKHADKIVARMEQDQALMEDTPVSEQLRKEALRDLPQSLTMKRCVKKKLSKSVSQKSKHRPISWMKRCKYQISTSFAKFRDNFINFNYFKLWHNTLKEIEGHFGSSYASYFKFLRWLFIMNFAIGLISFAFIAIPQILYDGSPGNQTKNSEMFRFEDIFIGGGSFKESILYYGHYTSHIVNLISGWNFSMPLSYFWTNFVLYLACFLILSVSVARSYRRNFIETEGGVKNVYANKIFCGWDYGIATREAAKLRSTAIYHELQELLSDALWQRRERTLSQQFQIFTIRILVNIVVLILLVGLGWALWLLLEEFSDRENNSVVVTSVVVNSIMLVAPSFFSYLSRYENYSSPRTNIYITLLRTFLLGSVIIGAILTFWLNKADSLLCWESSLGEEIYRLIIFDFIFSLIISTLVEMGYFIIQKLRGVENPQFEFNIAKHTLQLIYNQSLLWMGFLYLPILPLITSLKMFIIWYVRNECLRRFYKPPTKIWRAAQVHTWFLMMTFISILLIVAAHFYTMKSITTSKCGPFQDHHYIYEIITQNASDLESDNLGWTVVMYVTRPGVIALIMVALGITVYYLKERAHAQRHKVKLLREMLVWVAKDKEFVAQLYQRVTQGQSKFQHNLRSNRFVDPIQVVPNQWDDNSEFDRSSFTAKDSRYYQANKDR